MRLVWVVIPLVIFTIYTLSGSTFAEQSISEQIKDNPKFQRFDNKILGLMDEGIFEKINVRFFSPKFGIYQNEQTQQQAIKQISKLIDEWYGGQILQVSENQVGKYVEASIPIEHILSMAKHDFVFIVMYVGVESNNDEDIQLSEKIRTNSKFERFGDSLLEAIKNDEIDEYYVTILPAYYSFDVKDKHHEKELIEKLENALRNDHGIEEMAVSRTSISMLVPIEELPKIAEYDFAQRIIGEGFGFKYFNEDKSEGITFLDNDGQLFRLPYSIPGGKILYLGYLYFSLISNEGGFIDITFPRELIDPVDSYGEFLGLPTLAPHNDYEILEESCDYKTIRFTYKSSEHRIGLYSSVISAGAYPPRDAWFNSLPEDRFNFDFNEHQFEIITRQNGAICNLDFIPDENSINIKVNGKTHTTDSILVVIPKHVLDGDFQVSIDGNDVDFKHVKNELYNKLEIDHTFDKNHIINIEIVASDLFAHEIPKPHNPFVSVVTDKRFYTYMDWIQVFGFASEPEEYALVDYINVELTDSNDQIIKGPESLRIYSNQIFANTFYVNSHESLIPGEYTIHAYYPEYDAKTKIMIVDDFSSFLLMGAPEFVDSFGKPLDSLKGRGVLQILDSNQIQISANVTNSNLTSEQAFAYELDVQRLDVSDNFTPQWITGNLEANQTLNVSISWVPETSGLYAVSVSIGNEPNNPTQTITKIISIGDSTISILPYWVKNSAGWWADGQIDDAVYLKGIKALFDSKIINIQNIPEQNSETSILPKWIKNNAKWWAEGSISEQTYVEGIKYLVKKGIIPVS